MVLELYSVTVSKEQSLDHHNQLATFTVSHNYHKVCRTTEKRPAFQNEIQRCQLAGRMNVYLSFILYSLSCKASSDHSLLFLISCLFILLPPLIDTPLVCLHVYTVVQDIPLRILALLAEGSSTLIVSFHDKNTNVDSVHRSSYNRVCLILDLNCKYTFKENFWGHLIQHSTSNTDINSFIENAISKNNEQPNFD